MKRRSLRSRRGGALLTAVILATATGIIVAYIVSTSVLERKLTARNIAKIKADNAAEMMVDYGLADIAERFSEVSAFATNEFAPTLHPLTIRDELLDSIDTGDLHVDSLFLAASKLSNPVRYYVDPNNPTNTFDAHKGMNVIVRTVDLYGRATIEHPVFGNVTSYAKLKVQLRDAPLFAYGIFYNMDLEFHPGPSMSLTGTVHSNGTIWLAEGSALYFEGVMTAHEDIRIGIKKSGQQLVWTTGHEGNNVKFRNADGNWQSLYRGSGPTNELASYYTSVSDDSIFADLGYEDWREYATNEFGGNLQSGVHGVPLASPSGVRPYVPDEDGLTEKQNHGYSLIEPNLPVASPYHKGDAEREKFARKAGLIIRVHRDADDNHYDDERGTALPDNAVRLRTRPNVDDGWSSAAREQYDYIVDHPDDPESAPYVPREYNSSYYLSFAMLKREDQRDPTSSLVLNTTTIPTVGLDGVSVSVTRDEVSEVELDLNEDFDFDQDEDDEEYTTDGDALRAAFDEIFAAHPYRNEIDSGVDYNGDGDTSDFDGLIDRRVLQADSSTNGKARLDVIEINMAALADILENEDNNLFADYTPDEYFNGVVYVEFPTDNSTLPRTLDKVVHTYEKLGLILTQAGGTDPSVGRVPDPEYNKVDDRDEGFTLATNAPLYTRGNFNADGIRDGDAMDSDDPTDPDPPVALAADAITVLSDDWDFVSSRTNKTRASSTEVCAALCTGILPTNEGGRSVISGGNHNFIRFMESWSSRTLRYRGSMACAFESEIQADPQSTAYYDPPTREWGYFKRFSAGVLPPGTPTYASYRKSSFEFISQEEFEAEINNIGWSITVPLLP